ncbi:MAG TPA: hypothetical protein VFV42_09680 [Acidimicrobiales bacterium]|nr:hypothetical protein [Acidimicrobiales bacterium]
MVGTDAVLAAVDLTGTGWAAVVMGLAATDLALLPLWFRSRLGR